MHLVQADADVSALQKRIAELEARDTESRSTLASLQAKLKSTTDSHTQSKSEAAALEARLKEADAMRGKDEGLHAKIASLNEQLKKAGAESAGICSAETSKLKQQVDSVSKEAKQHQVGYSALTAAVTASRRCPRKSAHCLMKPWHCGSLT